MPSASLWMNGVSHAYPAGLRRDVPISIAVDEWGVMHLPADNRDVRRRRDRMIINLEDALVTATVFECLYPPCLFGPDG